MSEQPFTLDDLTRILVEAAGADEAAPLDDDILDTAFGLLGYESLALLETGGCIEREYGIALDDDTLSDDLTPRELIHTVNERLAAARVA
ncbi:phosphopantetheine-binding protein [Streptomyces sp. Je 1-369]|uniref:phosphopantetheine-binding protein n=1 Tax=Streptomyces sp. Je 1-369 TaxID=2966192 RepID=UPI0022857303|nr:phosphopantetheine-binding protein [Streptomyces sp. Je 1-369]WAL93055.1 phosphopantetheine-binding protein [Streptomyces sp. Je 1-369]WAL99925.1 phosphopantetheine-binding protein [Streptomyces sp. Je 1-369]